MEKLKQVLEARGVVSADDDLNAIIDGKGYSADALTDEQIAEIASELLNRTAIARTTASSTPAKSKRNGKLDRSKRTERTPQSDNGNAAQQTDIEIQAILTQLTIGRDAYAERVAEEGAAIVAETPNVVMSKLGEKLGEFQGNPEHFRQTAENWTNSLFPAG